VTVHGTWGITGSQWWRPQSEWSETASARGFIFADEPFLWSGELGVFGDRPHDPWQSAAHALIWYCAAKRLSAPDIVTHSHGLQVVAYAAAWGQHFGRVLDIEGPVRSDLFDVYRAAMGQVERWAHTWNRGDVIIGLGEFGADGPTRVMLPNALTIEIPASEGHSGLFEDLDMWDTLGLWEYLTNGTTPRGVSGQEGTSPSPGVTPPGAWPPQAP
jgi:hypothetical protein